MDIGLLLIAKFNPFERHTLSRALAPIPKAQHLAVDEHRETEKHLSRWRQRSLRILDRLDTFGVVWLPPST
jgi:hypothetical protein